MTCEKCKGELSYGSKYCENCGEKVAADVYTAEYNKTVWAKLDKAKDKYDTLFLKKITDSVVFKIISLVVVLIYFFFTMYGSLNGIRFKDSDAYTIEYYKAEDEYYISPISDEANLELFAPIKTESIVFTALKNGEECDRQEFTVEEYKEKGYTITGGEYDCIYIDAIRGKKSADKIKVIVRGAK